jgi:hypothetical protein
MHPAERGISWVRLALYPQAIYSLEISPVASTQGERCDEVESKGIKMMKNCGLLPSSSSGAEI